MQVKCEVKKNFTGCEPHWYMASPESYQRRWAAWAQGLPTPAHATSFYETYYY